jgi:acyl-CoA dehydrogenase
VKPSNTDKQRELSLKMIRAPIPNPSRFERVWKEHVYALNGQYKLKD